MLNETLGSRNTFQVKIELLKNFATCDKKKMRKICQIEKEQKASEIRRVEENTKEFSESRKISEVKVDAQRNLVLVKKKVSHVKTEKQQ